MLKSCCFYLLQVFFFTFAEVQVGKSQSQSQSQITRNFLQVNPPGLNVALFNQAYHFLTIFGEILPKFYPFQICSINAV